VGERGGPLTALVRLQRSPCARNRLIRMSLVLIPSDCCPACGSTLVAVEWDQPALIRHGGYGETQRTQGSLRATVFVVVRS
jgi:hypothetical protein